MSELLEGFLNLDDVRKKNFADLMEICKDQKSKIEALEKENAALRAQLGQGEPIGKFTGYFKKDEDSDSFIIHVRVDVVPEAGAKLYATPQSKPVTDGENK